MMTKSSPCAGAIVLLALTVVLGACASTSLINQWKSPDYSAGPMRKMLVVGVSQQPAVRRLFEDEFVAKLKAAGVEAVPSYTAIPEDRLTDQAVVEAAVKQAAPDGVLVTRLVKTEQMTQVAPSTAPTGFYGWYSSAWNGYYEPQTVYQYNVVTLETTLFSPPLSKVVWSGTTEAFAPTDVKRETAGFAQMIIGALRKQGII
jgi:hypothetical protein